MAPTPQAISRRIQYTTASGQARISRRIVIRQPWSPPWRTTMTCGRSLLFARGNWRSRHILAGGGVLFILALVAAGQAIDRSIRV